MIPDGYELIGDEYVRKIPLLLEREIEKHIETNIPSFFNKIGYKIKKRFQERQHLEMGNIAICSGPSFSGEEGRNFLFNLQAIVNAGDLKIHNKFNQLILQMRIAKTVRTGHLDKTGQNSLDLIDAASLSVSNISSKVTL